MELWKIGDRKGKHNMLNEEKRKEFVTDRGNAQYIINNELFKLQQKYPDISFDLMVCSSEAQDSFGWCINRINSAIIEADIKL